MKTVLIAGAGILGLATAFELAERGVEVTVLERGTSMREASWAAAGMLAASDPENPPQLAGLARYSLSLYPEFLRRIEHLSGLLVPLRTEQTLQICSREHLPAGVPVISGQEAASMVPGLGTDLRGCLLWLNEQSLDPRDLCRALPIAARVAGVRILEDRPVNTITTSADYITVSAGDCDYRADALVVCCGAWSGEFAPAPAAPRKGQMIAARMPPGHSPRLTAVIRTPEIYLVPRGSTPDDDGRIIIGATVEDAGFDRTVRADASAWLLEKAAELWPPIRNAVLEDAWTGIRPGTPDGLPLIGTARPATRRCWLAAGHFRNGILLAPGTAKAIATAMMGDTPVIDLRPFDPSRFTANEEPAWGGPAELQTEQLRPAR